VKVVILVPWRPGDYRRERNWLCTQRYLEEYAWPIYLGDSEGLWARGRAINQAAEDAGDWDVAVICDADTIGEHSTVRQAVLEARARQAGIRPHDRLFMLSPEQSADFMRFGPHGTVINFKTQVNKGGGILVVDRRAWDTIGGYDEAFEEWGHEDSHLNTRLLAQADWDMMAAPAWHLWHGRETRNTKRLMKNKSLMLGAQLEYADVIARESQRRGWDLAAYL
jgi:hypothetical protein